MSNHPEGLLPLQASDDYPEGQTIRCPHRRRTVDLPCHGSLGVVPAGTACSTRPIRTNDDARPGTLSVRCHRCKNLTEIRSREVARALRVVAA